MRITIANQRISAVLQDDYVNESGQMVSTTSSAGELLAHKVLGHGLGRAKKSPTYMHEDAIQAGNLYLRAVGINNIYSEGSNHRQYAYGALMMKSDAETIPWYLR